jgi:hypothetical protein
MRTLRSLRSSAIAATMIVAGATMVAWRSESAPLPPIRVVKSASCGCCTAWVAYMKKQGFTVTTEDKDEFMALKRSNGVTAQLESCHTAFVGGYVIEGHVPADLVKKLLAEKPAGIKGLSAPGMPQSAPGMDTPGQHYTVYSFDAQGHSKVYAQR